MHACIYFSSFGSHPIQTTGDFGLGGTLPREVGFLSNLSWMNLGTSVSDYYSCSIALEQCIDLFIFILRTNPLICSFLTNLFCFVLFYFILFAIRSDIIIFIHFLRLPNFNVPEYNDIEGSLPTHYGLLVNLQNMKFGKFVRSIFEYRNQSRCSSFCIVHIVSQQNVLVFVHV
jgi:hypothetical protein